jgi:hypothetical protein
MPYLFKPTEMGALRQEFQQHRQKKAPRSGGIRVAARE